MDKSYTYFGRANAMGAEITYSIIESRVLVEGRQYTRYGLRAESSDGASAEAPDIFGDREAALELAKRMAAGIVTPVTFMDVVEDAVYGAEFSHDAAGLIQAT